VCVEDVLQKSRSLVNFDQIMRSLFGDRSPRARKLLPKEEKKEPDPDVEVVVQRKCRPKGVSSKGVVVQKVLSSKGVVVQKELSSKRSCRPKGVSSRRIVVQRECRPNGVSSKGGVVQKDCRPNGVSSKGGVVQKDCRPKGVSSKRCCRPKELSSSWGCRPKGMSSSWGCRPKELLSKGVVVQTVCRPVGIVVQLGLSSKSCSWVRMKKKGRGGERAIYSRISNFTPRRLDLDRYWCLGLEPKTPHSVLDGVSVWLTSARRHWIDNIRAKRQETSAALDNLSTPCLCYQTLYCRGFTEG
jgi:hypothetical protein